MERSILFLMVTILIISCNSKNTKTNKQEQVILNESLRPAAAPDTIIFPEKDTLIFRQAYAMGDCFYRNKYSGRAECCANLNHQEVFIEPFEKRNWEQMVISKHKAKSAENPNGMDSIHIPCGSGDFELPSAFCNSVPFDDDSNFYYLITEKGISPMNVDSAEACILYECKRNSNDGQHVSTGHKSYSGKLIGRLSPSDSSINICFAMRTTKELDLKEIGFSNFKAVVLEDTLVLDGTLNDVERIEVVHEALINKDKKWTFIDENDSEHILIWQGSYELFIYNPAYCFLIDIPNYGQFILAQWEDECKGFHIFSTRNGIMELITSNSMYCGF